QFYLFLFFFQAEDGIRDRTVTGVQTCALPIWPSFSLTTVSTMPFTSLETSLALVCESNEGSGCLTAMTAVRPSRTSSPIRPCLRSEERRVGKECRSRWVA